MQFSADRINLRRKKSWIYILIIMFLFLGFFSLMTSKIYMEPINKNYHTNINQPIRLSSISMLTIQRWEYNPKDNFMEVVLKFENPDSEFTFESQEKINPKISLPIKTVYKDKENYVLHIKEISVNWEALALDIYQVNNQKVRIDFDSINKNQEEDSSVREKTLLRSVFTDQTKIVTNTNLKIKDYEAYHARILNMEQENIKEKIKKYNLAIELEHKNQTEIQTEINEMEDELKYETDEEKMNIQAKIASRNEDFTRSAETIEEYKNIQEKLTAQIELLDEKVNDIKER